MAPSDSTVAIDAAFKGPKLLARASEKATTIAVPDSAIAAASAARAGAISQATTMAASRMPYCLAAGTSKRFSTCQRKNLRTIVSPRAGSNACKANRAACATIRPAAMAAVAASHLRRSDRGPNAAHSKGIPTMVNSSS